MGDPRKTKKNYQTPSHPWNKVRIDEEKALLKEYGLKNKKEVWKMESVLRNSKSRAKLLSKSFGDQARKEELELLTRIKKLGILKHEEGLSDILALGLKDILERRLQTILCKKMLANSMKQARQFITHGHVTIEGKKITSPSYIVSLKEEALIDFNSKSSLVDPEHPERVVANKEVIGAQPVEEDFVVEGPEDKPKGEEKPKKSSKKEKSEPKVEDVAVEVAEEEPKVEAEEDKVEAEEPKVEAEEVKVKVDEPEVTVEKPEVETEEPKVEVETPKTEVVKEPEGVQDEVSEEKSE